MINRGSSHPRPLPTSAAPGPLFPNRRRASLGAALLLAASIGAVRFPDRYTLFEVLLGRLGLPIASNESTGDGLQYGGILLSALLLTGLVLLVRSASRRKFLVFLAAFLLFNPATSFWLYAYQSTLARGLNAVAIDLDSKSCVLREEESRVRGSCTFAARNRDGRVVEASAVLRPTSAGILEEAVREIPVPEPVRLPPGPNAVVELAFDMPAASFVASGGNGGGLFAITLTDGSSARTF